MNRSFSDQLAWTLSLLISGLAAGMFLVDFVSYYPGLPDYPIGPPLNFTSCLCLCERCLDMTIDHPGVRILHATSLLIFMPFCPINDGTRSPAATEA